MNTAIKNEDVFDSFNYEVDPETGEIISQDEISVEQLSRIARRLKWDKEKLEHNLTNLSTEIERLKGIKQLYVERFEKSRSYLVSKCEDIVEATGQDKMNYPGIGKFHWKTTRESINTEQYDTLGDDDKADLHSHNGMFFRIKTTISPDKKIKLEALKDGQSIEGFTINEKYKQFSFKEE